MFAICRDDAIEDPEADMTVEETAFIVTFQEALIKSRAMTAVMQCIAPPPFINSEISTSVQDTPALLKRSMDKVLPDGAIILRGPKHNRFNAIPSIASSCGSETVAML
jgi:hypothetical protein